MDHSYKNDVLNSIPVRLYRLPDVLRLTGLSKSTVYARVKTGEFPAPAPIFRGGRAVAWRSEDITGWIGRVGGAEAAN